MSTIRQAFRALVRTPGFTLAVILTLALGMGANTAFFSVVRGTLLRPLPNRAGDQLVYLRQASGASGEDNIGFSVPEVLDLRGGSTTLQGVAEYSSLQFTMHGHDDPVRINAGIVTGNYFDVMGLARVAGRLFDARDDGPAAAPVMVLTHDFWMRRFGGDTGVVGTSVRVNGRTVPVVGIVQPAPRFPGSTDVYVNMVTSPHHLSATMVHGRTHRMTEVFARLAPGVTLEQARAEVKRIEGVMHADHPDVYQEASRYALSVTPLRTSLTENARVTLWLLMGASTIVLLIAVANVANLTLIRGVRREREMTVRTALGAGTGRLRRFLLAENLTLALAGGVAGLALAFAARGLLVSFAQQFTPRADEIALDGAVLAFTLGVAFLAAIALSFAPRLGHEGSLAASLAAAGRRGTSSRHGHGMQRALVVAQVAISVVLLAGAGLFLRTLLNLGAVDPGVRIENVLTLELPIEANGRTQDQIIGMLEQIRGEAAALPGVIEAGIGSIVPLRSTGFMLDVAADGRPLAPGEPQPRAEFRTASPEYFRAAGISLLEGREFQATDRRDAARVVVLNRALADRLFPNESPIGKRVAWTGEVLRFIGLSGDWRTVVGVVGNTRDDGPEAQPAPIMFQPFAQEGFNGAFVIRATGDPASLGPSLLRIVRRHDAQQLVENVLTLEQVRDTRVAPRRLNALVITLFGALAVLIAAVGITAVLAFSVSSRVGEIGVRMSLGADSGSVQRMVLGEGGVLIALGLAMGVTGSVMAARLVTGLLFQVAPWDPVTLGGVVLLMTAVGVVACWIPAVRAGRVEPAVALRAD
ncbi:MAG TPA: ABC transporter permease [Gemmatimonadaceae bacterium]|nr:ABC transporter permease [Gemmatimonadaceae bacterium]